MRTYHHKHDRECSIARCETEAERRETKAAGYVRLSLTSVRQHLWSLFGAVSTTAIIEGEAYSWTFVKRETAR